MPFIKPKFTHTFPVEVTLTMPGGIPDTEPLKLTCRPVPHKDIVAREREVLTLVDGVAPGDSADVLDLVVVSWEPVPVVPGGDMSVPEYVPYSIENMRAILQAYPRATSEIWTAYYEAYSQARLGN